MNNDNNRTDRFFTILKRNGSHEAYDPNKIANAIQKCFVSTGQHIDDAELQTIVETVGTMLDADETLREVEHIQDLVEQQLMKQGHYAEAKSYILFRNKRTEQRHLLNRLAALMGGHGIDEVLKGIAKDYPEPQYALQILAEKEGGMNKSTTDAHRRLSSFITAAVELTTTDAPLWEFIAARLLDFQLVRNIRSLEQREGIGSFYEKLSLLTSQGLYGDYILHAYTEEEIEEAASFIDNDRDKLINYSGLDLLSKRYLLHTFDHQVVETVQEMFLGIALHLAMKEPHDRMTWVRKFYDMLSTLQVTMATPTLANARKPLHQLSSCFIDTVPDSLEGIYRSIDNFAQVSKYGGGMGLYFGKVRAVGGRIRGFKGAAGGVVRWLRLVNDTAVAVDQLGVRQGAVAVYLDVWHKDLPEFLQIRTNNGDDRMKAHDIFPAVCYPDLFWKMASEDLNQQWAMFCPNEIWLTKGYHWKIIMERNGRSDTSIVLLTRD